jgi:hypothetical protein
VQDVRGMIITRRFKMKEKKPKFIEESKLFVRKIIARGTDEFGRKYIKSQWFEVDGELELDSYNKPKNKDIIEIKFEIPDKDKLDIFGGLFRK